MNTQHCLVESVSEFIWEVKLFHCNTALNKQLKSSWNICYFGFSSKTERYRTFMKAFDLHTLMFQKIQKFDM